MLSMYFPVERNKQLHHFMKQHPRLSYLLLPLLNHGCLDQLIENLPNHQILFCNSKENNYILTIVDGYINVDKLKFKQSSKDNINEYEHLKISDISELPDHDPLFGEYRLEKNSITWKINIDERQSEIEIIRAEVKDLVNYLNQFENLILRLRNLMNDTEMESS